VVNLSFSFRTPSTSSLAPLPTVETRTPEPRLRGNGVFDEELSTVDLAFVSSFYLAVDNLAKEKPKRQNIPTLVFLLLQSPANQN
jgi:hypothetical protein